jgi:hypothetical protein
VRHTSRIAHAHASRGARLRSGTPCRTSAIAYRGWVRVLAGSPNRRRPPCRPNCRSTVPHSPCTVVASGRHASTRLRLRPALRPRGHPTGFPVQQRGRDVPRTARRPGRRRRPGTRHAGQRELLHLRRLPRPQLQHSPRQPDHVLRQSAPVRLPDLLHQHQRQHRRLQGNSGGPIYYWSGSRIIAAGVQSTGYFDPRVTRCFADGGSAVVASAVNRYNISGLRLLTN